MDYMLLKQVHITFAVVSIIGFIVRWGWRMSGSKFSQLKFTKAAPHIIDTLFLLSGVALTFTIQQFPVSSDWLSAKLIGLVLYILLGMLAMSGKVTRGLRLIAFLAALSCYAWILSVALLKTPWGLLGLI